jgi:hypothetical protein
VLTVALTLEPETTTPTKPDAFLRGAAAHMFGGHCPICDGELVGFFEVNVPPTPWVEGDCERCDVGWHLTILNEERSYLWPDRKLWPEEIRALYARGDSA